MHPVRMYCSALQAQFVASKYTSANRYRSYQCKKKKAQCEGIHYSAKQFAERKPRLIKRGQQIRGRGCKKDERCACKGTEARDDRPPRGDYAINSNRNEDHGKRESEFAI